MASSPPASLSKPGCLGPDRDAPGHIHGRGPRPNGAGGVRV
ncbi:hypothetical protein [Acetobacter estunensis]|nr:hypothetical protein [Acetobacter estunensis]